MRVLFAAVLAFLPAVPLASAWLEPEHYRIIDGGDGSEIGAGAATRLARRDYGSGVKAVAHPHPELVGNGTFDQLIDHMDPSKGTFPQRYWWDAASWKGPGSPVFVFNPGEVAADGFKGYTSNGTIPGLYADTFGGAVIVIEHRYWGKSIPFDTLTAETMQYLNLAQSVLDMTYFAKNVSLSFDTSDDHAANADKSPWVLVGGSYSGALAAWTQILDPGVFWAYHASSAVVQAIDDFWMYFAPIEEALPRNCSADVRKVVGYVDAVLARNDSHEITALKESFGLGQLTHHDDFAEQLTTPVWKWQSHQNEVFAFCDYLETNGGRSAPVDAGLGLEAVLPLYQAWINATSGATCRKYQCDSYANPEMFNKPDNLDGGRQWDWMLCNNPFGFWQVGPSVSDGTNIASSFMRPDHWSRRCPLKFPEVNGFTTGMARGFTEDMINAWTDGWNGDFHRVLFCNGEHDAWNSATVSSKFRPGGPRPSTPNAPIFTVKGGNHVPDLIIDDIPAEADVVAQELMVMGGWLADWKIIHPDVASSSTTSTTATATATATATGTEAPTTTATTSSTSTGGTTATAPARRMRRY